MASKLNAARIATTAGENVIIASGRTPGVLGRIIAGEDVGTLFLAQGQAVTSWKRWIGFTAQPRGYLVLDDGARRAIEKQGRSLLAIGIVDAVGNFQKGDVVALRDAHGAEFARGLIELLRRRRAAHQGPEDRADRRSPRPPPLRGSHPPRQHGRDSLETKLTQLA